MQGHLRGSVCRSRTYAPNHLQKQRPASLICFVLFVWLGWASLWAIQPPKKTVIGPAHPYFSATARSTASGLSPANVAQCYYVKFFHYRSEQNSNITSIMQHWPELRGYTLKLFRSPALSFPLKRKGRAKAPCNLAWLIEGARSAGNFDSNTCH